MNTALDQPPVPNIKPRVPIIAFLLSLCVPGLGQIYNGQVKKSAIFLVLIFFLPALFGATRWITNLRGFWTLCALFLALQLYISIDAFIQARRLKEYVPKPYNTWYFHLLLAVAIRALMWMVDFKSMLGIQTFKMPSVANEPTLHVGDYVVADMEAYNPQKPDYGDIVAYKRPDDMMYTSRIVALPSDTIEIARDIITIQGKKCKSTFLNGLHTLETGNGSTSSVNEYEELLPNGHNHRFYTYNSDSSPRINQDMKKVVVPEGKYCLIGDNRDDSQDSRLIGFVKMEDIYGRLVFTYWGASPARMNVNLRDK